MNEIQGLFLIVDNRAMDGHTPQERKLCNLRDKAIIYLYLDTGIRLREQADILISEINLNTLTVRVMGKNGEEWTLDFSKNTSGTIYCLPGRNGI